MVSIFDGDGFLFICTAGNKILDENGEPIKVDNKFTYTEKSLEEVYKSVDEVLLSILSKIGSFDYIGFLGNGRNFRYDIYPEYKANRAKLEKPKWFKECKQYLVDKYNFKLCDGTEADDNVLITRNLLKDKYETIIITGDKDLIKCTSGNFFNINNYEIVYTSEEQAEAAFMSSLICGDTSDNISGLRSKGLKHVEKLITKYSKLSYPIILESYIEVLGEYNGIKEFSLNYQLLKLLTEKQDFILPEINKFEI